MHCTLAHAQDEGFCNEGEMDVHDKLEPLCMVTDSTIPVHLS